MFRLILALAAACLLASCARGLDADQARLCRMVVPALNADAARIVIDNAMAGPRARALRIGYHAIGRDGAERSRYVICLFGGDGLDASRSRLIGLATEDGIMSDAAFYFLQRFYLEDARDPPVDPGPPPAPDLPQVSPALAYALQQFLVALPSAATYALIASAYALIYGLVGRIILSLGEFAALGSLAGVVGVGLALSFMAITPLAGIMVALAFAVLATSLHGFAVGRVAISQLLRGTGQQVLIGSVGLSLVLSEYLRLAVGPEMRWLPPAFNEPWPLMRAGAFIVTLTPVSLAAAALGFAAAAALLLYLARSRYGRAWRAVADDRKAAALCGVNETAVRDRAFIIACALSGLAGVIVTLLYGGMGFAGGFSLGLKSLIAAVLGGIGSVPGACLGALVIAAFEAGWSSALPIEHRDLAVFLLLAAILILRPGGFFGEARLTARPV